MIDNETLKKIKEIDLLSYLMQAEPNELKHIRGDIYCTRTHDSLKISNGKWQWWSRGIGGRSALDYLIHVKEMSFLEAANKLRECLNLQPVDCKRITEIEHKAFELPEKNNNSITVINYLTSRCIDKQIISECIHNGMIYESKKYHNAVFVGYDTDNNAKYAALRGTTEKRYVGEASGSNKEYTFRLCSNKSNDKVHLFESAIDLLSYATLIKLHSQDWRKENLLSLSGIYYEKNHLESAYKIPKALQKYLSDRPNTKTLMFHLDNDEAGRISFNCISDALKSKYEIINLPPIEGKDINDELCLKLNKTRQVNKGEEI